MAVDELTEIASSEKRRCSVGWCFEASRDLYRRMVEIGDFAGALRAVKQIADLASKHVQNRQDENGEASEGGQPAEIGRLREAEGTREEAEP